MTPPVDIDALDRLSPVERAQAVDALRQLGIFLPNGTKRRGRPRSATLDRNRGLFPALSERSIARVTRAQRLVVAAAVELDLGAEWAADRLRTMTTTATRSNGTVNVAMFERLAESVVAATTALHGGSS